MLQIRMENMGPILVHMDALNVFRIHVSTNLRTFVYNKHALSSPLCFMGKNRAEESGADDKIIIFHRNTYPFIFKKAPRRHLAEIQNQYILGDYRIGHFKIFYI